MRVFRAFGVSVLLVIFNTPALAQMGIKGGLPDRGTPEEAVAMVKRVKKMYIAEGAEKTFKAVSGLSHGFRDRDLYPFIVHIDGWMAAHYIPALRGASFVDHTDSKGRYFFRLMLNVVRNSGTGWIEYSFINPITKVIEEKRAYIEKLDEEYFVAVGVFSRMSEERIN